MALKEYGGRERAETWRRDPGKGADAEKRKRGYEGRWKGSKELKRGSGLESGHRNWEADRLRELGRVEGPGRGRRN